MISNIESKLFSIKGLKCGYNGIDPILTIDDLTIPRGKFIAILGVSGAGKSTILETLGLMNYTLLDGSEILFHDGQGTKYNFKEVWESQDHSQIEKIRNEHFSFIFQETNLMPNFTAYENACLSQMIQGSALKKAMEKTQYRLQEIGLSDIDESKKVNALSGGQRQRIAFVRAITPEYTILFGDEPTGNLDEKTSEDLLNIIREDIQNKRGSAIIVTHNIQLATHFADMIMVITKKDGIGRLESENLFISERKEDEVIWMDISGHFIDQIEDRIKSLL